MATVYAAEMRYNDAPKPVRAEPKSPSTLHELGVAAHAYAEAAAAYLVARYALEDARDRYNGARDQFVKDADLEGV